MRAELFVQLAIGTVPFAVAILAFRQATRATASAAEIERNKVDSQAYARAKTIYEDALKQLERDLARERETSNVLRSDLTTVQGRVSELERRDTQIRRKLAAAGIDPSVLD